MVNPNQESPESPETSASQVSSGNTSLNLNEMTPETIVKYIKTLTDRVDLLYILESIRAVLGSDEDSETDTDALEVTPEDQSGFISVKRDDSVII